VAEGGGPDQYTFNVVPVHDGSGSLTLGATVNGSIGTPGEQDHYSFTLAQPSLLYFDALTNDNTLRWDLVGPEGVSVDLRTFQNSDTVIGTDLWWALPAADYTLTIDASGDATPGYGFRLVDLASATALTPGTPKSG